MLYHSICRFDDGFPGGSLAHSTPFQERMARMPAKINIPPLEIKED
ncbi:hypothetical protein ACFL5W_01565 [Thermodesulfobacteriota bacterium]